MVMDACSNKTKGQNILHVYVATVVSPNNTVQYCSELTTIVHPPVLLACARVPLCNVASRGTLTFCVTVTDEDSSQTESCQPR